jgi:hypothetical protein
MTTEQAFTELLNSKNAESVLSINKSYLRKLKSQAKAGIFIPEKSMRYYLIKAGYILEQETQWKQP